MWEIRPKRIFGTARTHRSLNLSTNVPRCPCYFLLLFFLFTLSANYFIEKAYHLAELVYAVQTCVSFNPKSSITMNSIIPYTLDVRFFLEISHTFRFVLI